MPLLSYTKIYRSIFFWSFSLELGNLPRTFQKKHENENYSKKNLQETFLRILAVVFCSVLYNRSLAPWCTPWELFQMVVCQGQNCNTVYCHTQFITTQRSNAFKLNYFFLNKVYSGCRKQKLLLGAVEGLHRDGGEASREDIFLYFLQGCCFFHWVEGEGGGDLQAEKAVFNQENFFWLSTPSSSHAVW